jgi:hypothetical protein
VVLQDGVYYVLERGRYICKFEQHHGEFVLPVSASEGGFLFIDFNMDRVIVVVVINVHEYFVTADAILELTHDWDQVAVHTRDFINSLVVDIQL